MPDQGKYLIFLSHNKRGILKVQATLTRLPCPIYASRGASCASKSSLEASIITSHLVQAEEAHSF